MSKKKNAPKDPAKSKEKSHQELSEEQLEHVSGGLDGVKGEVTDNKHKEHIEIA